MGSGSSKAPSALETQRAHALEMQDKFSIGEDDEDGTGEDSQPLATADIEADDFSFQPGTQPETTRCEWLSGFFTRKQNAFELGSFDGDVPEQLDCPEPKANILSRVTFSWLDSLMIKGWKKPLEHYDLWKLNPIDRSSANLNKFSHHWKKDYPNLLLALHHTFGLYFYLAGIIKFFQDCLQFVVPVLLRDLIAYLNDPEASLSYGLWLVAILTGSYIIKTIFVQVYFHMVFRTGMNIRSAVVTTVYNKALRLSPSSRKELSLGQMVDLMSNDCQRLMDICTYLHVLWSGPFQIIVSLILLWRIIGVSTLFGVALMLLLIPANAFAMRKITKVRKEAMVFTDERVRWMNEILQGMKAIKLYAYETRLIRMVLAIRDQELKRLRTQKLIRAANNILSYTSPLFVSIVSLGAYAIINGGISSEVAFPAISLFNLLRFPLSMLPEMINQSAEARVSLGRLKHFLTFEEMSDVENDQEPEVDELDRTIRLSVKGNFHWENLEDAPVLTNVNIRIPEGEIMAVVGPVGSGKSALVSSILGETKASEGSGVRLHGSVALAAQQPWIMNATIRENILFGKPLNEKKYQRVVEACALLPDFQQLPAADMTEIGERDINLSGGQKQRICIARTIYSEADIYIFDDPLSAVDAHVGNHIFEHAISGILKGKTVLLVTHQLQYLPNVDEIVLLGRNGTISGQGTYNTLLQNNEEFIHMIEEHGSMAKQQEDATQDSITTITEEEKEATQELSKSTSSKEVAIQKGDTVSVPISNGNDKGKLVEKEERGIGAVQFKMYILYVMAAGSKFMVFTILLCYILAQLTRIGTDWWVAYWSDQTDNAQDGGDERLFFYLSIYCLWGLANVLIVAICSFCVAFTTIRCSKVIHERLLFRIMNGPLSFFETTPLGRILNRFSKDQDTVDVQLADSLSGYVNILVVCSGTLLLMIVVLPLTLTFLIPLIAIYYLVQLYYRSTSRELKRLESISKSPIFAHFSETLGGLTTIRAYNAQSRFSIDNENKLDHNQEAYFAMVSSNRWLGIRLDFIASFVVLAAALFSILDHTMDPSLAGLVLSYAFSTTSWMSWLVRSTAEVEQNMNSIERINFYSNIEQESSSGNAANDNDDVSLKGRRSQPSDAENELLMSESEQSSRASIWPINGDIEFSNVVLHYRADIERPALNNLSFAIRGGEKIGVCGRTGAGKSSLLTAIFRIVELTSGQIKVDGIDISQMDLRYLRSHLAIIPQDPVLFSGSLRFNLDPFEEFSDDDIWVALRTVELEQVIRDLPDQLSHKVAEMGSGFSVGQRQLLSFARAILRHQKILFLDEATASCDIITDQLIQRTLREKFKDYTVVTIAHRLNTIFDYDRILVMSDGHVAEFDTPSNLLGNPSSVFYSMVQETNSALSSSSSSSSSSPSPSPLPVM